MLRETGHQLSYQTVDETSIIEIDKTPITEEEKKFEEDYKKLNSSTSVRHSKADGSSILTASGSDAYPSAKFAFTAYELINGQSSDTLKKIYKDIFGNSLDGVKSAKDISESHYTKCDEFYNICKAEHGRIFFKTNELLMEDLRTRHKDIAKSSISSRKGLFEVFLEHYTYQPSPGERFELTIPELEQLEKDAELTGFNLEIIDDRHIRIISNTNTESNKEIFSAEFDGLVIDIDKLNKAALEEAGINIVKTEGCIDPHIAESFFDYVRKLDSKSTEEGLKLQQKYKVEILRKAINKELGKNYLVTPDDLTSIQINYTVSVSDQAVTCTSDIKETSISVPIATPVTNTEKIKSRN